MKIDKKKSYYLIAGLIVLLTFIGGITYAYFSSGVVLDSKNISVITDTSTAFFSNISNPISLVADRSNMTSSNVGWSFTNTSEITIHMDGEVGDYCYFDLVYQKSGDRYEPDVSKNGGGVTLITSTTGDLTSGGNAYGSTFNYLTETDYGSIGRLLADGKINVSLKWTNLDTSQNTNQNKAFNGKIKVVNVVCNENKKEPIFLILIR